MPKVTSDIGDSSDASDLAHDEPGAVPVRPKTSANGADEQSESEEGDEDEYQVEAIRKHKGKRDKVLYEIKWVGYPASENTWEPIENLLPDAAQIVTDYHKRLGFDPTQEDAPGQGTKRSTSHPKSTSKKQKTDNQTVEIGSWVPQTKDWEPHVREVTHIEKNDNEGGYTVYIQWNNGKKTKVSMKQIYDHCPRPMLRFYEKHLKFTTTDEPSTDE